MTITPTRQRPARLLATLPALWLAGAAQAQSPSQAQQYDCLIEPYQRIELRSPVTGLIKAVNVERGSTVQKGQVLIELDSGVEAATLAAARYRAQMQGAVRSAESRSKFAQAKERRFDDLSKQKYVSQQDSDEAAASAQVAEADLLEARDNRELAQLEVRRLTEVIEQRRLRSPVAGLVTDRTQNPGELAQSGDGAKPIIQLAQVHPLRVELVLPVARYGTLAVGATATIEPEAPLKGRYTAQIKHIDRVVDAASGTFRVRLELPNPDGAITAGVKCRAGFAGGRPAGAGDASAR
ncbi:efflux RND transporter periplasmic adaptor subunit [Aquincola sp. MAHUQ-54]|uniref:Efflux RND transporter periplasmic adaptor subunit n=1 Tax=Aquincola agrisoli TaxID=3119538 RepID=A0AAW9Q9L5_9BURK